jgi:hypothetical protein
MPLTKEAKRDKEERQKEARKRLDDAKKNGKTKTQM